MLSDGVVLDYIILMLYYHRGAGRDELGMGYHGVAVRHCLLCCCGRHRCIALLDIYAGVGSSACIL